MVVQFSSKKQLNQHFAFIQNRKVLHKCAICYKNFESKDCVKTHISNVHGGNTLQDFEMHNSKLTSESNPRIHKDTVHERKRYHKCNQCRTSFETVEELKKHFLLIHVAKKAFVCDFCGISYYSNKILTDHKFSKHKVIEHIKTRSYQCDLCESQFQG